MRSAKLFSLLLALFFACLQPFAPVLAADPGLATIERGLPSELKSTVIVLTGRDLLRQALDLVKADDFDGAEHLLLSSFDLDSDDSHQLHSSFSGYQQFVAQRRMRRQASSNEYVVQAKERLAAGELQEALAAAYLAVEVSPDPQLLRAQAWLEELVQLCAAEAERLSEQGQYSKAAIILREIAGIYADDQSWKQQLEQTALHAGILGAYDKESNWQQRLRDIDTHDFENAVRYIDRYYVKEVDYRKMILGMIKGFRSFLTTKRLEESFPGLADTQAVADLLDFIDQKNTHFQDAPYITAADLKRTYWQIILENQQKLNVPDPILVDLLSSQAFQGLDDYTEMIWPDQQEWFARSTMGTFSGIGVQIRLNEAKQLEVVTPLVDTPAFKAGLQAGDLIVAVDGKSTEGFTINEAVRHITGKKGTKVALTIRRPGRAEEFSVSIVRDVIRIKSVRGYDRMPDNGWNYLLDETEKIAYIKISNFTHNTAKELDAAISACRAQDARALILDLRFDPGGTLAAAEDVADRFLPSRELIVSTRGRRTKPYVAETSMPDSCAGWPVVVLTSDRSASAAEIVAGALQDHDRAIVVGERTYGKGLVQRPFRLGPRYKSQVTVKVTTAYWYLPMGRNVQRSDESEQWGVQPDFPVELTLDEVKALYARWLEAAIIHPNNVELDEPADDSDPSEAPADSQPDSGSESFSPEPSEPAPTPDTDEPADESTETELPDLPDPQLQSALLVARLELMLTK